MSCFFIVGPTAVGKSGIAVDVAEGIEAEIVNADAFQIYRGLDILTAKPDVRAQRRVRHHLLGAVELAETMSAVKFRGLASSTLECIRQLGKAAIVVSGSGLYVKSLTHGFDKLPPPDPELRAQLSGSALSKLAEELQKLNPDSAARTDLRNRQRVIRAIEIARAIPNKSERSTGTGKQRSTPFPAHADNCEPRGVLLVRERQDLYHRINQRVTAMFAAGVENEVRRTGLIGATADRAIGLWEIQHLIRGDISREECIAKIQQATRQYAKRQLTWFRRQTSFPELNLTVISHQEAVSTLLRMAQFAPA